MISPTNLMLDLVELLHTPLAGRVGIKDPTEEQRLDLYAQVYGLPGQRDRTETRPEFDVSIYGPLFSLVEYAALALESELVRYPHRVSSGGRSVVIDRVTVTASTTELPWPVDSRVTRFNGTYSLVYRG
ncbi:MAG: hypothetical protein M3Q39_10005 [Actinomycetota bacterium]|nr:hypothetical protein [Actinomycetota bacterium]